MRLHRSLIPALDTPTYRQLYSLNWRADSPMRKALVRYKHHPDACVFVAVEGERVLGWSLVTPGRLPKQIRASFYVRRSERRRGIGRKLVRAVDRLAKQKGCRWGYFDHSKAVKPFFSQLPRRAFSVYDTPGLYQLWDGQRWVYPNPWRK